MAPDADLRDALAVFEAASAGSRWWPTAGWSAWSPWTCSSTSRPTWRALVRPVTGQVLFGHREPVAPAVTS